MGIEFVWKDEYSVGVPNLDEQHQRMFSLGNHLQEVDLKNNQEVIFKLFKHTREHFKTEEDHMKEIGFPDLDYHRELHDKLITDLSRIVEGRIDNQDKLNEFIMFVYTWIMDHILNYDKKYFDFVAKGGT